jgi:hypothetical protein
VEEQGPMIAKQQKQIEALAAGLQKVSARLELNKPRPQTVLNNQQSHDCMITTLRRFVLVRFDQVARSVVRRARGEYDWSLVYDASI